MTEHYKTTIRTMSGKILVNGKLAEAKTSQRGVVFNPAAMDEIGNIALCEDADIDAAVSAAHKAQSEWKKVSACERGKLVQACGQILKDNAKILAEIMSYETGKAIRTESEVELGVIADTFNFYGGLGLELKGESIPFDPNMLTVTIREPLGVVAAIIPWNVPLMLFAMKVAPALVAGNTVVVKASPEASFCVLKASEFINTILPPGVLNIVTGGAQTGKKLVAHSKVRKVAFTGSVESGRDVYQNAAQKLIPVTLELGGKSPFIICEDADMDAVVKSAYEGMRFTRQGQSCSAASRFLLHESIHDEFVERLLKILDQKIMGDPMDPKTDIGSIISQTQFDKIQGFLKLAEEDSSLRIHYGSKLPLEPHLKKGLFIRPSLITGLKNSNEICQKEIFGPVASVIKWSKFEEAIAMANDTEFGLAAGIWTRDFPKALQAVHFLDAGFVQVNQYIVFRPSLAFGGFKNSGLGKEGSLKAMVEQYTREKTIIMNVQG